jgi:hypothetical protein
MFFNSKTTIFSRMEDRLKAEAYLNEYQNQASLKNAPATEEYKKYMTKSLINRGFLFKNYESIEALYKSSLQELFTNEFKNVFLYDINRDIKDIYSSIENVKNMGPIGKYDFFSSILTSIGAKYLPTFDSFELDLDKLDFDVSLSNIEKKEIIDLRTDKDELPVLYRLLLDEELLTGPKNDIIYYIHPRIEASFEYTPISNTQRYLGPQEGQNYYINVGDTTSPSYEIVQDFEIGYNYIQITNDEYEAGPQENEEYYILDVISGEFNLCENLTEFETFAIYYKKIEGFIFSKDVTYYTYIQTNSSYDWNNFIPIDNLSEFDNDEHYYIKELDYENIELTEEEINNIKKEIITKKVDSVLSFYMKDLISNMKELFSKYSIYTVMNSISVNNDSYIKTVLQIVYSKFLHIFATISYGITISDYLTDTSILKSLVNESIELGLSKVSTISDMMNSNYLNNKIIENLIPTSLKEKVFCHYKLYSPVADQIEYNQVNLPITLVTAIMTENLINLRTILENISIESISIKTLYVLTIHSFVNFINMIYYNAYISKNKVPVIKSVQELLKNFEPSYDKVISGKELKEFIKLEEL